MERANMVHMANQIALVLAGYPREEGIAGITDHLNRSWEHRMRQQIIQYGGSGLHEFALEAVKRLPQYASAPPKSA